MKMWALVLLVGVCATHAGPVDQRSAARQSYERNLQKLSDFSAENDLYTLFSADQKDVPVNLVGEDEVKTLGEQLTRTIDFEDSFENTIDANEEHSKFKRDLSHDSEENIDKDEPLDEDPEIEMPTDRSEEDLDSAEEETERVKRDLEDEDHVLTELEDDWPNEAVDGHDENMVERNLHDAVEDWSDELGEDDQFIVSEKGTDRVKRDLEEDNDEDSTEEEENWIKSVIEEQHEEKRGLRQVLVVTDGEEGGKQETNNDYYDDDDDDRK